jgi:hypothetical protein
VRSAPARWGVPRQNSVRATSRPAGTFHQQHVADQSTWVFHGTLRDTVGRRQRLAKLIAGALDPDCQRSAQAAVELLHLVATVLEPTLSHLAGLRVEHGDALIPRVQIYAHKRHTLALLRHWPEW